MDNKKDVLKYLKDEAENINIPESLEPEAMKKHLKQQVAQKAFQRRKTIRKWSLIAACLCIFTVGAFLFSIRSEKMPTDDSQIVESNGPLKESKISETIEEEIPFPTISYEDIYASMETIWSQYDDIPVTSGTRLENGVIIEEAAEMEAEKQMSSVQNLANDFGSTNIQTVGVDEGDIVKNDGRYLYQKVRLDQKDSFGWAIQIADTKDGLKELSRTDLFDSIEEFYVWNDSLIIIQQKYTESTAVETSSMKMSVCYDQSISSNAYHEIIIYDISDRTAPKNIHKFTLQGDYASSRITDGYFYGFSRYYANPGKGKEDYDSYIPLLNGKRLQADNIYLPENIQTTSYLVFVTIDLSAPTEFVQTKGIISNGNMYYVSANNIYVANSIYSELHEGKNTNTTSIMRFSYDKGKITLRAKGIVNGILDSTFSMDEYNNHLRLVSTIWEYTTEKLVDDRTGRVIGYDTIDESKTNALYVLDEQLQIKGKIEGLAKDEQIYSARFMGDTAYFVTFRQTDPLFTVNLQDPEKPEILSELKISGFSDYLHFYGDDRLLGIGMEADEKTGAQQGMKLSMFDISDKTNVSEISKYRMEKYNFSDALYNHHCVMISPSKNLFGFCAEGSQRGKNCRDYFVFSYENDAFVEKLKIDVQTVNGIYDTVRGTFIGDTFYLLKDNGSIQSYDLNTGKLLDKIGS